MRESSPPTEATLPPGTLVGLRKLPATMSAPVVFVTAKVQAAEVEYDKSLDAIGVLAKPFDPMQLAVQMRGPWEREE